MLVTYAAQHIQHMQKALELMNLKLAHVVSDIAGRTGLAIIRAILDGQRDPRALATLRDPHCKADAATIARALEGNWRAEHLFELRQAVELLESYQQHIAGCDREIEAQLTRFADKPVGPTPTHAPRRRKARRTTLSFDARQHLHRLTGVYRMLRFGTDYLDRGQDYYERRYQGRVVVQLMRRAHQLGYTLTKNDGRAEATSTATP
jgi:transposase